jgi:hypothetical protein
MTKRASATAGGEVVCRASCVEGQLGVSLRAGPC